MVLKATQQAECLAAADSMASGLHNCRLVGLTMALQSALFGSGSRKPHVGCNERFKSQAFFQLPRKL